MRFFGDSLIFVGLVLCSFSPGPAAPLEVQNVQMTHLPGGVRISWDSSDGAGVLYDIYGGSTFYLRASGGGFDGGSCIVDDLGFSSYDDFSPNPPPGDAFYFLLRAQDADGVGTYGGSNRNSRAAGSNLPCHFLSFCNPTDEPQPNIGLTENPGGGGCPPGMLLVDTFCIDQYEASVKIHGAVEWTPYSAPPGTVSVGVSREMAIPQSNMSRTKADVVCANAGKRLCSDSEWLRACQGSAGNTYPYGDTLVPDNCNDTRTVHPLVEYFGTSEPWVFTYVRHPCIAQQPDTVEKAGDHSACVTAEGLFDMAGNLSEWTSDPTGVLRGGHFTDSAINGPGCLWRVTAHPPSYSDYTTGFRCCADP